MMYSLAVLLVTTTLACAAQDSSISPMRAPLCHVLCTSGLGGPPCGNYCEAVQANTLNKAIEAKEEQPTKPIKGPRKSMCPVLCGYGLGEPLCSCAKFIVEPKYVKPSVDWSDLCSQFCTREGLTVYGCTPCVSHEKYAEALQPKNHAGGLTRQGDSDVNWDEWCHELCEAGDGGIACNCDINP